MAVSFVTYFLEIFRISLQASFIIGIVLIVRWFFQRIYMAESKKCFLWIIPVVRLILPFRIESRFSILSNLFYNNFFIDESNREVIFNQGLEQDILNFTEAVLKNGLNNIKNVTLSVVAVLWAIGILFLLLYGVVLAVRMRKQIRFSMCLEKNIHLTDGLSSAAIFGLKSPVIYIPTDLSEETIDYIIYHEEMHIKRKDHIIKVLLYFVCIVFWFQPFVWIMYYFLLKDMELACDEAVLMHFGLDKKKEYAKALLELSMYMKVDKWNPLIYVERNPQKRIQWVMSCESPRKSFLWLWILIVCGVLFLTNPEQNQEVIHENDVVKSYDLTEDEPIVLFDSSGDGVRKTSYLSFAIEERTIVTLNMEQTCENSRLYADEVQKTKLHIQKKESGVWIQINASNSWYESVTELVYGLMPGEYRFVLQSGYPCSRIQFKTEEYEKAAFVQGNASEFMDSKCGQSVKGMVAVGENKSQWFHFSVLEEKKMLYTTCYYGISSAEITLYLYDENGEQIREMNLWYDYGQEQSCGSFEKGEYYVEIVPREIRSGTYFELRLESEDMTK